MSLRFHTIKAVHKVWHKICLVFFDVEDLEAVTVLVLGACFEDKVVIGYGPQRGWIFNT